MRNPDLVGDRPGRRGHRLAQAGCALLLAAAAPVCVHAQIAPRAGGQMPVAPLQPPPVPPPVVPQPPLPSVAATPADAAFELHGVRFVGSTVFTDAELGAVAAAYLGRKVNLQDLERLAQRVTALYRDRGFLLAQALIPVQEVRGGVVEVSILEGRLGKVRIEFDPATPVAESKVREFTDRLAPGEPLREDTLTRVMLLLSDLPGVRAGASLEAGEAAGSTDLVISVGPGKRWNLEFQGDNYGLESTSLYRVGLAGRWNSPGGAGDNLDYRLQVGVDGRLAFGRLAYEYPIGGGGSRLGVAASALDYALVDDFISLDANGRANVLEFAYSYPLIRARAQNLFAKMMLQRMWLDESYEAVGVSIDKDITGFSAALNYEASDAVLGGGYTGAGFALYLGHLSLDPAARQADLRNTAGGFTLVDYNLSRLQKLVANTQLYVGLTGQFTDRNLDPVEKIALGGPQAVRAYAPATIIADEGLVAQAELRYSPIQELSLQAFYDWGRGKRNKEPIATVDLDNVVQLGGYGLGLFWNGFERLTLRASVAWPTGHLRTSDQRVPRVYFQVGFAL